MSGISCARDGVTQVPVDRDLRKVAAKLAADYEHLLCKEVTTVYRTEGTRVWSLKQGLWNLLDVQNRKSVVAAAQHLF